MHGSATAPSNIALVKYWGKRDVALNLPSTGSISVTLAGLETQTNVHFDRSLAEDAIVINGRDVPAQSKRVGAFLDLVRQQYGTRLHARVESTNNFPTAAGLASSASGFAALAVAVDEALSLDLGPEALSVLARRGSGSAARSIFSGFVEMRPGEREDGTDAHAVPLAGPDALPLRVVVAVTTTRAKKVGSTEGMQRSGQTSPFHRAWLSQVKADLVALREALDARDFDQLGRVSESNALRMHATMWASVPPLIYWNATTMAAIQEVHTLREAGCPAWITIDAGPQVKALCPPEHADTVATALRGIEGIEQVLTLEPGQGARRGTAA